MNIAMGSAAGLVLGVLTALAMAAITKRIGNSTELLEKTGVEPLVELPGPGTSNASEVREDRMLTLASFVSSHIPTKPKVIAVIDSRGSDEARHIAEDLARVLAQQEYRTVLIHAESGPQPTEQVGFNDVLRDSGLVHVLLRDSAVEKLKILPRGTLFANRYSRMTSARIAAVLDELRADVDAVVVAAPAIAATPDTQLLCAAADLTIVVVDIRSSRADDVSSVVGVLKSAGANIPGAVLIDGSRRHSSRSPIKSDPQSQRANAVVAQRGGSSDTVAPDLPQ
jgi:Mrp family chromosome partitioning ATPase